MPYIRVSVVRPRKGEEQRTEDLVRRIAKLAGEAEGALESYILRPHDDSGEIARITIYESEEAAEHAAVDDTLMALRSELHLLVEPGHVERAFFSI